MSDHISQTLKEMGEPVTRENWIDLAWGPDILYSDDWDAEHEEQLPDELQDWSLFAFVDDEVIYDPEGEIDDDDADDSDDDYNDDETIDYSLDPEESDEDDIDAFNEELEEGFEDYNPDPDWTKGEGGKFTGSKGGAKGGELHGVGGKAKSPEALRKAHAREVMKFRERIGETPAEKKAIYEALKKEGGKHPGRSYTSHAVQDKHGIIHTDNVTDVARALYEGKQVNLIDRTEVANSITYLGKVADRMAKGGFKGTFDLCKVSISGTNLFCESTKGIPRIKMPQLKGIPLEGSKADAMPKNKSGEVDLNPMFREWLTSEFGFTTTDEVEIASHLKATQNELNGAKIAGMAGAMRAGKIKEEALFVSQDNYIVDGHHRWAAKVAIDYDDGKPGDVTQPVMRVDAGIYELLTLSNRFAAIMGIPQAGVGNVLKQHAMAEPDKAKEPEKTKSKDRNLDPDWIKGEGGRFEGSKPGQRGSGEGDDREALTYEAVVQKLSEPPTNTPKPVPLETPIKVPSSEATFERHTLVPAGTDLNWVYAQGLDTTGWATKILHGPDMTALANPDVADKTFQAMFERYQPDAPVPKFGLDAFYLQPGSKRVKDWAPTWVQELNDFPEGFARPVVSMPNLGVPEMGPRLMLYENAQADPTTTDASTKLGSAAYYSGKFDKIVFYTDLVGLNVQSILAHEIGHMWDRGRRWDEQPSGSREFRNSYAAMMSDNARLPKSKQWPESGRYYMYRTETWAFLTEVLMAPESAKRRHPGYKKMKAMVEKYGLLDYAIEWYQKHGVSL